MNEFDKFPQSSEKNTPIFETLIVKDRTVIEARHKEIVEEMLREEISAEPNIGNLEGLYDSNTIFLGLSGLKERYGDKWPAIAETLSEYLNQEGGKRLRPLLLLNGYRMFSRGAEPSQEIINAGVGIEILHETALLLDDVTDNSKLRRGALSLWAKIENIPVISPSDPKQVTADVGPLPFSWTRHLMVDEVDDKIKSEVNKIFWQAVLDMKHGQDDDNISARASEWPPLERVLEQFYLKTSSYSMRLPLLFALHASGTKIDNNILEGIEVFSRGFGLAFQLHDDLLITKTNSEIGKDSTLDAFNGTKIPVVILARQLGNDEEINFIDQVWGKPALLTPENILRLKKIFETTGALQKIVEMMKLEIEKAKTGLDMIAKSGFDISSLKHILNTGLPWMDDLNVPIENQK